MRKFRGSYSKQKNSEFRGGISIRVNHKQSFRVSTGNNSFELGSHIHQCTQFRAPACGFRTVVEHRNDPGSNRHTPNGVEDVAVIRLTRAREGETRFHSVAIHGPGRVMEELCGSCSPGEFVGVEGDAEDAGGHLFKESSGGDVEMEQCKGFGTRVELEGEGDMAVAVAEEGAGELAAESDEREGVAAVEEEMEERVEEGVEKRGGSVRRGG